MNQIIQEKKGLSEMEAKAWIDREKASAYAAGDFLRGVIVCPMIFASNCYMYRLHRENNHFYVTIMDLNSLNKRKRKIQVPRI